MNENLIYVRENEAALVVTAYSILEKAKLRAQEEAVWPNHAAGMLFFSQWEAPIIQAYDELRARYQKERGLSELPELVPCTPGGPAPPEQGFVQSGTPLHEFHYYSRAAPKEEAPSVMDLEKILIKRVLLKRQAQAVYRWMGDYYHLLSIADLATLIHATLIDELGIKGAANQLAGVQAFLLSDPAIEDVPLDAEKTSLLCLKNGLLDLRTLTMHAHDSKYFFTSGIDVDWLGAQPCPCFDAFLNQVSGGDPLLIRRLWQVIGYVLSPDNRAKRFILLQGVGNSGKSVLGNLLESFFEADAVSHLDLFRFRERFSLATLADKRINISMDLPRGELSDQSVAAIKELTGRDAVTVEEKYKAPRSAVITCSLVFGTNHVLKLHTPDEAFANRVLLVPFRYAVPKASQDPYLLEKLKAERSGILFHALMTYREVLAAGYAFAGDDVFTFESQTAEQYKSAAETMMEFIQLCCEAADVFTPTSVLLHAYNIFAAAGNGAEILDGASFSRQFSLLCGDNVRRKKQRYHGVPTNGYEGVKLKEDIFDE